MSNKYFIHQSSFVDEPVEIGQGTKIWHFCHVMKGAKIGENCRIGQSVVIHGPAVLGNNVKIQNNVSVYDGVTLEDDVFCGPSMVFTNVFNPRSEYPKNKNEYLKTHVYKGATIGANVTIICGNSIGCYSFIGAGSVVTKSVLDYALYYGNPASFKNWICECGEKLDFNTADETACRSCSKKYQKHNDKVTRIK